LCARPGTNPKRANSPKACLAIIWHLAILGQRLMMHLL
jgi:hypothetical protein